MNRFVYILNETGTGSIKINTTEKATYGKDFKILEYIHQTDYKKITQAQPYEWRPFLEWWVYVVMALSLFLLCVLVNFIVKRLNDVRLDERLISLYEKTSRSTQVHGVLIEQEIKKVPDVKVSHHPTVGISMIFTKEDNQKLTRLGEIPIKIIEEREPNEDKQETIKMKAKAIINIYNNSNFALSKRICENSDKGNGSIDSRLRNINSAHVCSITRDTTLVDDANSCDAKRSKSIDEYKSSYFNDPGNQHREEVNTPKGINTPKEIITPTAISIHTETNTLTEISTLKEVSLGQVTCCHEVASLVELNNLNAKNYSLDLKTISPASTSKISVVSNKGRLIQKISCKILNRMVSSHETVVAKISESPKENVSENSFLEKEVKANSRNAALESDFNNFIALTIKQLLQDVLDKLDILEIVKSYEKVDDIPEPKE